MTTVLTEHGENAIDGATIDGDQLWLSQDELTATTGWVLKPEGLCHGEVCVPVPKDQGDNLVRDGAINVSAFWRLLDRPVLHDKAGTTWMLGAGSSDRANALRSLQAPDFELPDLSGKLHRLSDYRGKRVFLTTWSSW